MLRIIRTGRESKGRLQRLVLSHFVACSVTFCCMFVPFCRSFVSFCHMGAGTSMGILTHVKRSLAFPGLKSGSAPTKSAFADSDRPNPRRRVSLLQRRISIRLLSVAREFTRWA